MAYSRCFDDLHHAATFVASGANASEFEIWPPDEHLLVILPPHRRAADSVWLFTARVPVRYQIVPFGIKIRDLKLELVFRRQWQDRCAKGCRVERNRPFL